VAVFAITSRTLRQLEQEFPRIAFGHVTVPLSPPSRSLKDTGQAVGSAKGLGRWSEREARRVQREAPGGLPAERIFDLAAIEATRPDGAGRR
jgi:hypothetical protein